jgi:hypothetical protein
MIERPSSQPATQGLRRLDGQPITALFGISKAATEDREKSNHQSTQEETSNLVLMFFVYHVNIISMYKSY